MGDGSLVHDSVTVSSGDYYPEVTAAAGVCLKYEVPQLEYMYGCTATVVGMLLGYYDRWGYLGYNVSNLIDGNVELNARGLDGNMYDMDAFDTVLGNAVASEEYVDRFYGQSSTVELEYTFVNGNKNNPVLNTSAWNCLADYLGTGQYWRGNSDLSTTFYYTTLSAIMNTKQTVTLNGVNMPIKYRDFLYGLNLYVEDAGYKLDADNCKSVKTDTDGGDFSFDDYCNEIDAGRLVIIHISGHSMLGYGYDRSTGEIIFDDTYRNNQRMQWDGTYYYSNGYRELEAVTLIAFDVSSLTVLPGRPAMPEVTVSTDIWTKDGVTLSVYFADNSVLNEYSYDNKKWYVYSKPLKINENGKVYFRSKDIFDEYSDTVVYEVNNIDTDMPVFSVSGNVEYWTNEDVILTVNAEDYLSGVNKVEFSFDRKIWQTGAVVTVEANKYVYFRVTDNAGNIAEQNINVTKIDKTPPSAPSVYADITNPTVQNVIVSAYFSNDTAVKEYSFDNESWNFYNTGVLMHDNGKVYFRGKDAAGNISAVAEYIVDNIDRIAPDKPVVTADITDSTVQNVMVSAYFSEDSVHREFSYDSFYWYGYDNGVLMRDNGKVYFRSKDAAGNISAVAEYTVDNIDRIAPEKPAAVVSYSGLTSKAVTVSVEFADDCVIRQYKINNNEWQDYIGEFEIAENCTVCFSCSDTAGNNSSSYIEIVNIDKESPSAPDKMSAVVSGYKAAINWNAVSDNGCAGVKGYYIRYGTDRDLSGDGEFIGINEFYSGVLAVGTYYYQIMTADNAGNLSEWSSVQSFDVEAFIENLQGNADGISWNPIPGVNGYIVEYSADDFETVIKFETASNGIDFFALPEGDYQWRVKADCGNSVSIGETVISQYSDNEPKKSVSNADGNTDVFFAEVNGQWRYGYAAVHKGSCGVWNGTGEKVELEGKNRISDIFIGSNDANVLVLTDSANGDALFVDDIFSAFGDNARLNQIDEIRSGAGDDIIDMTSQRFCYSGDGMKIYGGNGDDTIWAADGSNILFGNDGDDRIVGNSGNDVIIGGNGDDSMHGGGGNDIFTFCGNWGCDTVEQLAGGTVTLWFADGCADNWNSDTFTYSDGINTVYIAGVAADNITLKFGGDMSGVTDDGDYGKIFEAVNRILV